MVFNSKHILYALRQNSILLGYCLPSGTVTEPSFLIQLGQPLLGDGKCDKISYFNKDDLIALLPL